MRYLGVLLTAGLFFPLYAQREADKYRYAYFSGGSFWSTEADLEPLPGVIEAVSGYAENPNRGRRQAVRITYDYNLISYDQLLDAFIRTIDPADPGGSFADRGFAYTAAVYFTDDNQRKTINIMMKNLSLLDEFRGKPLAVAVQRFTDFTPAEEAQQDFYKKDKSQYRISRYNSGRDAFIQRVWKQAPAKFLTLNDDALMETPYFTQLPFMEKYMKYKAPSKEELKKTLSPQSYKVTQENGTEAAFTPGNFNDEKRRGLYVDIVSGEPLFSSSDKFDSGSGWPSFTRPLNKDLIVEKEDISFFMKRVEVRSRFAGSHLGHVFSDGPKPTGLRYCINGAAMRFIPYEDLDKEGYGDFKSQI